MQTYGNTIFEKNGFILVEVLEDDAAGDNLIIGYAILDSNRKELSFFGSYEDALKEFTRITDDDDDDDSDDSKPPSKYKR